ncbi:MAG: LacI family DNA-binding transcriptional regulator [Armatimonadaceae bacterium]
MAQITLNRVAQEAGVSVSTVSRVLNRTETPIDISPATVARVQEVAQTLGYVPSGAARAMRTGRSRTIGVLGTSADFFQNVRSSFVGQIMSGLVEGAARAGYHLTLLTGFPSSPESGRPGADLGMADALIVLNRDLPNDPAARRAVQAWNRPLVYALDYPEEIGEQERALLHAVAPDDRQGGFLATRALQNAGHRRIAFARKTYFPRIFDRRQAGWRDALPDGGETDPLVWHTENLTPEAVRHAVHAGVSAVVCANSVVADSVLECAGAAGVRIPADLALIRFGYDEPSPDTRFAEVIHPLHEEIAEAVRIAVHMIESGTEPEHRSHLLPYTLRHGATFPDAQ